MFEAFSTPTTDRFLEDYTVGATYICGSFTITEDVETLASPAPLTTGVSAALTAGLTAAQ